ncbi:MAG: PAS domain S-box protein, partial [Flavobacteriales bacterium]
MKDALKILHLEDNQADAELVRMVLESHFPELGLHQIYKKDDFIEQMRSGNYTLILSDYIIPGFDGMEALETTLKLRPDLPFIFISGTIGEERAVEALRLGATDYVLKENLVKLPYVINRAIKEKRAKEEKENNKREVFQAHQLLESVFNNTNMQVAYLDVNMNFLKVNRAYAITEGQTPDYYVGKNHFELFPNKENEAIFYEVIKSGKPHFAYMKAFEYTLNPEKGITHWDWSLIPTVDSAGEINGLVVTLLDVSDRIKYEAAIKESEERLTLATRITRLGTYDWWPKLKKLYWDERMHEIFGVDLNSTVDRNQVFFSRLHPDDDKRVAKRFYSILEPTSKLDHFTDEFKIVLPNGDVKYISSYGMCQRNSTGDVIRATGTCLDVTNQRQAEIELKESENRQRAILEAIPDIMFTVSRNGRYLSHQFNTESSSRLLVPWKQMKGKRKHDFIPAKLADLMVKKIELAIDTNVPQGAEYALVENGVEYFYESRFVKINEDAVLQIVRDVTKRRKAETALSASEQKFRELAETIKEVFWLTDWITKESLYVSPAYEEVYGYSVESLMKDSKSWAQHIHKDDREWVKKEYYEKAEKGKYNVEFRVVHPDGSIKWVHESAFPIKENNKVVRMAGYSVDVTERKLAEQNLQFTTNILNRVSSLVVVINKKTDLVYVSPSAKGMLGYPPEELLGQNWWKLTMIDKKQYTEEKKLVNRILKKGLLVFDHYYESEIKTKSGKIKWMAWSKAET